MNLPERKQECGIPGCEQAGGPHSFFALYCTFLHCIVLLLTSVYSNLSGTEIVVMAIAAIAAMAETTIIILFISVIPPCTLFVPRINASRVLL